MLLGWFIEGGIDADVERINERVYRELPHLPTNDGWLGLVPPEAYRALEGRGQEPPLPGAEARSTQASDGRKPT